MTGSREFRRLLLIGLLLVCAAGGTYVVLRAGYGGRPVFIHVRWAPSTADDIRRELEERFSLTDGELRDGTTWGYVLTDISRDNIRALVTNPLAEDTHQLDREAYRPGYFVPRLPYQTDYPLIPAGMEVLALVLAAIGGVALAAAATESLAPSGVRDRLASMRRLLLQPAVSTRAASAATLSWIEERIPIATPESAALFRIVFGLVLLGIVLQRPVDPAWASDPGNVVSPVHRALAALFAGRDPIVNALPAWIAASGALFICGLLTRTAFALLTAGVFAWAVLYTTQTTYHTVSAFLVTLVCLQWARWGDAWSVDAWLRQRAIDAPSRRYGYTTWVPGFVLGLIFLAAAFAKLRDSGIAWILNGTVKYHFLSDSRQAMVDWGLQLGQNHAIAVGLSLGAIVIETFVIAGALSRRYAYRFVAGTAALALLTGFTLLQGLFWPGWWILLLSFLPWHRVGRGSPIPVRPPAPAPARVILALIVLQLGVSLTRLEVSPFLSTYDMYATTYASPAEYEQKSGDSYWLVATNESGTRHQCRISRREADVIAGVIIASDPAAVRDEALERCFDDLDARSAIAVESTRARVDWMRWRLEEPLRVRITERLR